MKGGAGGGCRVVGEDLPGPLEELNEVLAA